MHTSGKVAVGFVIVLIAVAMYFTSKAFDVRDRWMKQAQDNEAAIKKNEEELAEKRRTLKIKQAEYARTMIGWDREWMSAAAQTDANGNIGIQVGTNQGIQQGDLLYCFLQKPDGTSEYLGDFKVTRPTEAGSFAAPYSRRRPSDFKQQQFQNVRVRTMLPNQYVKRLEDLNRSLVEAELNIRSNKEEVARQARLAEMAEKVIAARMAELNGDPDKANQQIPEVHIKGLLTSIVDEEEARNAALIEADRLMRDLKKTRDEFQAIREENQQRVDALPKPAA